MRVLSGLLLFVLFAAYANAQQDAKVVAEIAAGNEKLVKNAPFSADAISESVQVLADGNRIVRSSTSKLYRNSEGRFRREMSGGAGGMLGTYYGFGHGVSILDPVVGQRVMLDIDDKTARIVQLGSGQTIAIAGRSVPAPKPITDAQRAEIEAKLQSAENLTNEQRLKLQRQLAEARSMVETAASTKTVGVTVTQAPVAASGSLGSTYTSLLPSVTKYETQTEDLGARDFEGVSATGTRTVTTIPAGAIGNERPIEIAYERWYSKELELVVYSKHSDPRIGEQTYRLTNIVRSEPDPSLFSVPTGYRVLADPPGVYKIRSTMPAVPAVPRPPQAITVNSTKP